MNKNTARRLVSLTPLLLAPLLGGCLTTFAMNGLNGAAPCPTGAVTAASNNFHTIQSLNPGATQADLQVLQPPEQREQLTLADGRTVEVWSYRTGHPRCRNMPTEHEFTPVVVDATGLIIGVGEAARQAVRGHASSAVNLTPSAGPNLANILLKGRF